MQTGRPGWVSAPAAPLFQRDPDGPRILWPPASPPPTSDPLTAPRPVQTDPTQELRLPIFEQVRSGWFTTTTGGPTGTGHSTTPGGDPPVDVGWQTPADAGWRAAARAAESAPVGTTREGLPKRRPGAQLIPGAVPDHTAAPAAAGGEWRDPAAVSAALSAYARGLATGRARHTNPEPVRSPAR
jgi:hypothetical protein